MTNEPTIKDVAHEAGVSVATVSRVLNGLPGFSPETEKKVKKAIDKLGYRRNDIARNLKTKKSSTIAVLLPRVETTFYVKILNGIEDAAQRCGYSVMICHVGSYGNRTREYMQMLVQKQVAGVIGCSLPPKEEIDKLITNSKIPCVLVSTLSFKYPIPYIKVDDYKASYAAVSYLINMGHKKIACLAGSEDDIVAGIPRLKGYKDALLDNGLHIDESLIRYSRFSYKTGLKEAKTLFGSTEKFTAIAACCDEVAVAAMSAAYEMGLSVPDDVSVIGYDNTSTAEMAIPQLTSVAQPLYEMGEKSFLMLRSIIEKGTKVENVIMPFKIIKRATVKKKE